MKKILMIIAPEGYQDIEYGDPKQIFLDEGFEVATASLVKKAKGKFGGETDVDLLLDEVNVEDYDCVVFVGGPGTPVYFNNEKALQIAKDSLAKGKFTCAICAGPGILANADILAGKKATSHPSVSQMLIDAKAIYTALGTEQDGKIITADGPASAKNFAKLIVKNL